MPKSTQAKAAPKPASQKAKAAPIETTSVWPQEGPTLQNMAPPATATPIPGSTVPATRTVPPEVLAEPRPVGVTPREVLDETLAAAKQFMTLPDAPLDAKAFADGPNTDAVQKKINQAAKEWFAGESDYQRRQRAELAAAAQENRKPRRVVRTRPVLREPDRSVIVDSQGNPAGKPGYTQRWVSVHDGDRITYQRAHAFRQQGYEVIVDPHTGNPIVGPFGMAMQAPPEAEGKRIFEAARRVVDPDTRTGMASETQFEKAVDQINHELGSNILSVSRDSDHGTKVHAIQTG